MPPTRSGYPTTYLWEETWARDSVLDLVRQFIHEVEEENVRLTFDQKVEQVIQEIVDGKSVCVVSCRRSPEPVFLTWKGVTVEEGGDFFVRSGPGTVQLSPEDTSEYIRTRFPDTRAK